jgi:hypothetical protein
VVEIIWDSRRRHAGEIWGTALKQPSDSETLSPRHSRLGSVYPTNRGVAYNEGGDSKGLRPASAPVFEKLLKRSIRVLTRASTASYLHSC